MMNQIFWAFNFFILRIQLSIFIIFIIVAFE